jgi:hypothetical protein
MPYTIHFSIDVDVAMPVEDKSKSLLPFLSSPKLLPNESEAEFQSGLQSLLSELDNPSPLGVALVSQLNESLWWIKRHTVDKELLLHEAMARLLSKGVAIVRLMTIGKSPRLLNTIWTAARTRMNRNGLRTYSLSRSLLSPIFALGVLRMQPIISRWWMI